MVRELCFALLNPVTKVIPGVQLLFIIVFALSACGGGDSADVNAPDTSSIPSFQAVRLSPVLESSNANSSSVGVNGGSISAIGSDGTRYRLEIPAAALTATTPISLTPVSSIDDLPLDNGLLAAVDMQPSGLQFLIPATLNISLPADAPVLSVGFNWIGSNNAFAIQPPSISSDRRTITLSVKHFSGYGMGIAGASQLSQVAGELVALSSDESVANSLFFSVTTESELFSTIEDWFDLIVQPRLDEGDDSVVKALVAHEAYINWLAIIDLVPSPEFLSRVLSGREQTISNLTLHFAAYTQPNCNGAVENWKDWIRIPDELRLRIINHYFFEDEADNFPALIGGSFFPDKISCAILESEFVNPPTELADDQTEIPLTLRTYITHPGGTTPIAANINMSYSDGASGEAQLITEVSDGLVQFQVDRDPTWPSIQVSADVFENSLGRDEVLNHTLGLIIGENALSFLANPLGPKPILAIGATRALTVELNIPGQQVEGVIVNFTLDGPGSLSASSGVIENVGLNLASVEYIAPASPVIKDLIATITATVSHDGQNYEAKYVLHPYWQDIEIRVNTGSTLVEATNDSVNIIGDGPFGLHAIITGAGETTADAPIAVDLPMDNVVFDANNPVQQTLRLESGTCCVNTVTAPVAANGIAIAEWLPEFAENFESHVIEVRYNDGESVDSIGATVTLVRTTVQLGGVFINVPETIDPGETVNITVFAPLNYWVELSVTGGELGAVAGLATQGINGSPDLTTTLTNLPGHSCIAVQARVYTESGGELVGISFPREISVNMLGGSFLNTFATLYVDIEDRGEGTSVSQGGRVPSISTNRCAIDASAGPTQASNASVDIQKNYMGTDPEWIGSCNGASASASGSRSATISKDPALTEITHQIQGSITTTVNGRRVCFDPAGNSISNADSEKGSILDLAQPAFVTFSNLQATSTAVIISSSDSSCSNSFARVFLAPVLPFFDGFGIAGVDEIYACVDSSGDATCSNLNSVPATSFAGVLPAGRYQINTFMRAPYSDNESCSAAFSVDISVQAVTPQ